MHALVIVTLTLAGLAGVLFGSDVLDRRLTIRSGGEVGPADLTPAAVDAAVDEALAPAPASASRPHTSLVRPLAPCHHCRGRSTATPLTALRTPGPLRVPTPH